MNEELQMKKLISFYKINHFLFLINEDLFQISDFLIFAIFKMTDFLKMICSVNQNS